MNVIWANRLIGGTKKWHEVPPNRVEGVKAELISRVKKGKITAEKYESITGEAYPGGEDGE